MKTSVTLSLAAVLVTLSLSAAPVTKETISSGGRQRTFYLFAPQGEGAQPLLILLHGSGRSGKVLVDHWRRLAEKEGIVLAGPDATVPESWSYPIDGPDFLRDVVDAVKKKTSIDDRRIYLFGHSAGAVFALQMTMLESAYFAASAVHAGFLPEPDRSIIALAERKIPVMLIVGTNDPYFPVAGVRATHEAIAAAGHPAQLTVIPRHTHDYYSKSRSINEKVSSFLFLHVNENPARYRVWKAP